MDHSRSGKHRRNGDGRVRMIAREYADFMRVQLFVQVEGQPNKAGSREMLSLNGISRDSGATGWYRSCPQPSQLDESPMQTPRAR